MKNREADQGCIRSLLEADELDISVVISDPALPDNPMIFVSGEFEKQTGYSVKASLGRTCRFLQGKATDAHAIEAVRQGLQTRTRLTIDLLNFRKDGTPFKNRLRIRPIFADDGQLIHFAGAQNPVK